MKVLIVFGVIVACAYGATVPESFPQCKVTDPEIEKCLLDGVEKMRPRLKTGIPEVNLPALDPFVVPTLKLNRTAANLRLKAVIKNVKAYGGSNFKIEKLKVNLNNKFVAEIKLSIPKLVVVGDYDVKGSQILAINLTGKGKINGNFTKIAVVAKGLAKPITKDGVEYLQVDKVVTKVKIGNGQIALSDSVNPLAATSAATFFNSSPNVVLDILSPLVEETAATVVKAIINKMFGSVPLKNILQS
ncbi:circadian clock-controlled protein daywake-like [Battus philenor]|uniref:circadian clock-controlled protein daywake-like n=1 Tax=Battus philenor TaxID=42288 RepID=UPI0035D10334